MDKKRFILISVILILIAAIIIVGFVLKENKKECSYENFDSCDKSCKTNEDCSKAVNCFCLNKNEFSKVELPDDMKNIPSACAPKECECSGVIKQPLTDGCRCCECGTMWWLKQGEWVPDPETIPKTRDRPDEIIEDEIEF